MGRRGWMTVCGLKRPDSSKTKSSVGKRGPESDTVRCSAVRCTVQFAFLVQLGSLISSIWAL